MAGFEWDGAEYDGAVYGAADRPRWLLDNQVLEVVGHTRTWNSLTLEVRARRDADRALLDELKDDAGSFSERVRADGRYEARDTVGGSNTVTVRPPRTFEPPRRDGTFLVDSVSATRTNTTGEAERATVSLVPRASRPPDPDVTAGISSGAWTFAFDLGTVETDRVASEISNDGDRVEVTLTLTPRETDVLEASVAAVGGVVSERLPDADTRVRDVTPGDRQTVDVTPPTASPVDAGAYVATEWRTEAVTSNRHQTTITLDAV